jgi:predicted DNA-binding transcriptional regulator YafY
MVPFKPSVHRMYFIDKKVRTETYPTTVSLAADYEVKYGKSVDPRTIAGDIAALKEKFHAPLGYDYEKRGYFYSDPYFQLPVLKEDPDNLLPALAEERHPRTAAIPEWQQRFIASLAERLLPLQRGEKRPKKASVLLDGPALDLEEAGAVTRPLLQALEDTAALDIRYMEAGKKAVSLVFWPLHLVCAPGYSLVFGSAQTGEASSPEEGRYCLLYLDRIREAVIRQERGKSPAYIHVQTTGGRDIEVVLARETSDLVLVFALPDEGSAKGPQPEYALLVQTEIFARK